MQGYYDPHPATSLERPIALVGFMGTATTQTAQAICALTGLPLADLDRRIEGQAGRSISHIVLREGDTALRAAERRLLTAALRERPAPVIALSDGALLDPRCQAEVSAHARLVWLDADLGELTRRVRRDQAARPGSLPALMQRGAQVSEDALKPLLNVRRPGYAAAELRVDIGTRNPTQVARQLLQLLAL